MDIQNQLLAMYRDGEMRGLLCYKCHYAFTISWQVRVKTLREGGREGEREGEGGREEGGREGESERLHVL